jgi:hypothetical protein
MRINFFSEYPSKQDMPRLLRPNHHQARIDYDELAARDTPITFTLSAKGPTRKGILTREGIPSMHSCGVCPYVRYHKIVKFVSKGKEERRTFEQVMSVRPI